jgi:hypothetical protein
MNYNGEDVELAQHNMDIAIPFVVSTRNYGLLWDNNSITRFGNPAPYAHVGQGLKVSSGGKPGWKADYFLGEKLAVSRQEPFIDYQFIKDQANWPDAAKAQTVASPTSGQNTAGVVVGKQTVVWSGSVTPDKTGTHKFRLYSSSYVKVFADGKEVLSRWRQNWNPWFHNFELPMTAGKPVALRVEWEPNAGYLALYHSDPLASRTAFAVAVVGCRPGDRLLLCRRPQHGRSDRGLSGAHRQGRDDAELGLWLLAEPPALRDAGAIARRSCANIASARSRSTTSCRTGSTGPRTNGAAIASTPSASPIRSAW